MTPPPSFPASGLYRSSKAHPSQGESFPADCLIYVGYAQPEQHADPFIVRPHRNQHNRWYWQQPTTPLVEAEWAQSLLPLPREGYYTLSQAFLPPGGGRWHQGAIVQLGYDQQGRAILFIAEDRESDEENCLSFSDKGQRVKDELLPSLRWAPILPVPKKDPGWIH